MTPAMSNRHPKLIVPSQAHVNPVGELLLWARPSVHTNKF